MKKRAQVVILPLADAACLPELLREKIASVERFERVYVAEGKMSFGMQDAFLAQLRGCLAAIEAAMAVDAAHRRVGF